MAARKEKKVSFNDALTLLEQEKGIDRNIVLDSLGEALMKTYKKHYVGSDAVVKVEIDSEKGEITLYDIKTVVDDVNNEDFEISLEEAQEIDKNYKVGDEIVNEVSPEIFGRLAATQTKQTLTQAIREAEKEALYNEYVDKLDDIITGTVDRVEERFAIINIGKTGALLPLKAQIPGEKILEGQRIKVYVNDVERGKKGTHISVSRTDPGLVKRLFEMEVPEIFDGIVEVKAVSREPGERSKIAVFSDNKDIDPIGACVGPKGTRVRNVVLELNGEMIDIILWDEDPIIYIKHALSPSEIKEVLIDEKEHSALVIVPDNQLSLAIGKKGLNARLAVRLTGWKIDIKSESEIEKKGIDSKYLEPETVEVVEPEDEDIFEESFDDEEVEEVIEEIVEEPELKPEVKEEKDEDTVNINDLNIDVEALGQGDQNDEDYVKVFTEDEYDDYDEDYDEDYDDYDDYDPKYDEDIDYDAYDEYYDN